MKFDPLTDLEPVGQISKVGLVMVLNTKAIPGVEDYESLVKYSKSHPGEMFFLLHPVSVLRAISPGSSLLCRLV